ncbi:hypothetical protein WJX81_000356 [Elliptochloris bilobata]|uniref:Clp1 P-loop domain-containing protein n=1 Tax=Elliptochloris bilobata TaxID=381761 RepID=A0AAW1R2P8_9CHLO
MGRGSEGAQRARRAKKSDHVSSIGTADRRDDANGTRKMELPVGQVALMCGNALLAVKSGSLWVHGLLVREGSAPVRVCADARIGGALALEAAPGDVQVPLLREAVVSFQLRPAHGSAGGSGSGLAAPAATPIPAEWRQAADSIAAASAACASAGHPAAVVAVCGSKGTGKSTFARLLVNALLSRGSGCVAFLDVDCGQPELTVPGLLSAHLLREPLLGPPHLHQREPGAARFIGDTSPQADPAAYVAAAVSLARWLQGSAGGAPLVVNTPGWVKGIGYEALAAVLAGVRPSHTVLMQAPAVRRNLPPEPFWLPAPPSGALPPPPPIIVQLPAAEALAPDAGGARRASAVEARALLWTALARRCLHEPPAGAEIDGSPGGTLCSEESPALGGWDADAQAAAAAALAAQTPYVACLDDLDVQFLHADVPPRQLCCALNVDAAARRVYLLTPLGERNLQRVTTMQVGRLELPPELMQGGGFASPYLSIGSIAADGTGAGMIKSRNNLLRAAQAG